MEKMYRVLLACGNEDYGKVLASTFQLTDRYIVAGSAKDGAEALICFVTRARTFWSWT